MLKIQMFLFNILKHLSPDKNDRWSEVKGIPYKKDQSQPMKRKTIVYENGLPILIHYK